MPVRSRSRDSRSSRNWSASVDRAQLDPAPRHSPGPGPRRRGSAPGGCSMRARRSRSSDLGGVLADLLRQPRQQGVLRVREPPAQPRAQGQRVPQHRQVPRAGRSPGRPGPGCAPGRRPGSDLPQVCAPTLQEPADRLRGDRAPARSRRGRPASGAAAGSPMGVAVRSRMPARVCSGRPERLSVISRLRRVAASRITASSRRSVLKPRMWGRAARWVSRTYCSRQPAAPDRQRHRRSRSPPGRGSRAGR
jgi:hypothetical protein